jgi:hypothetical protein
MAIETQKPPVERIYPPKLVFMLVNPLMTWLLGTSFGKRIEGLARLEFTGRRSGKKYKLVSAVHDIGDRKAILTNSGWRANFKGGRPLRVLIGGEERQMVATLEDDPDEVARVYAERIESLGSSAAGRLGVRVNVDRTPNYEELRDLVEREGLSVIYLTAD